MATQSPFSLLEGLLVNLPSFNFQPPVWAVDEAQRRIVLLLNHILIHEEEATARLVRQKGRSVLMQWRMFELKLIATPAGLLDRAPLDVTPDLILSITEESPLTLAQVILRGAKPSVRIEGDVQLAAEVNWLVEHVRWDMEEDLSGVIGDAPAHVIGQATRSMASALRQFLGASTSAGSGKAQA